MAQEIGLSRGHASRLERGAISPVLRTLKALSRFLDMSLSAFVREIEKEQQKLQKKSRKPD